jgi:CRISPR system Cascade subunit CasA
MNLLTDPWIPVREGAVFKQIRYKDVLCADNPDLQIALPRDDLELACIQMLAAMTQVIFMPHDRNELRERVKTPLTENEYDAGVKKYIDWFDLDHPQWPFMQINETGAKETTPIQKMFVGLPAGNNHAFFNNGYVKKNKSIYSDITQVCESCAAVAIFNLSSNSPNISGKHKAGIRGNNPVNSFIYNKNLRKIVWLNTLSKEWCNRFYSSENDFPVWVQSIKKNSTIYQNDIGLFRGLFWVPLLIKLVVDESNDVHTCDCCGNASKKMYREFYLGSEFMFSIHGLWKHPNVAFVLDPKRGKYTLSFRNKAPAWVQLNEILFKNIQKRSPGYIPALVVQQYQEVFNNSMHILIGGYRSKSATDAAIRQRRHELYSFPSGWNTVHSDRLHEIVIVGIEFHSLLTSELFKLMKGIKSKKKSIKGIGEKLKIDKYASDLFYHATEPLIHSMLRETKLREFISSKNHYLEELAAICIEIFEQVTKPYVIKPELIGSVSLARVKLKRLLKKLKEEHTTVTGGAV